MTIPSFLLTIGLLTASVAALCGQTQALGPVYPVIEPDLLALIKTHAREEALSASSAFNEKKNLLTQWAKEPAGKKLPEAKEEKRLVFQSSPQVASVLGQGYQRQWLFIDGDNIEHVQVARAFMKEKADTRRVILVSGSVEQTQKALQKRVWFDQAGVLIQKLRIESLPAFVEMTSMGVTVTERPASFFLKDGN